jgi:hypothetical protein
MQIKSFYCGIVISFLSILVFCSSNAYSANWQALGELPESPKFGKTDYFVDLASISTAGNKRSVWLKSVFSKPQPYGEGRTYTSLLSFAHYNCSNKTYVVTRIDVYSAEGDLVESEKQDLNYVPIPEGSLDDKMYEFVCNYKK